MTQLSPGLASVLVLALCVAGCSTADAPAPPPDAGSGSSGFFEPRETDASTTSRRIAVQPAVVVRVGGGIRGVPVGLDSVSPTTRHRVATEVTRGADALAVLSLPPGLDPAAGLEVVLDLPLSTPLRLLVDPHEGGLVDLPMPETGSIVVVRDENDTGDATIHVMHERSGGADPGARPAMSQRTDSRRVVFPWVGLGLDFTVTVASRVKSEARFAGPSRAGETVVVPLEMQRNRPRIAGRLVDSAGAPVAATVVTAQILDAAGPRSLRAGEMPVAAATTDAAGRFDLVFSDESAGGDGATIEFLTGGVRRRSAEIRLASIDWRELVDVGDVELGETPLLVAGVLRNANGHRPKFGHVQVEFQSGQDWRPLADAWAQIDANGWFVVRRALPDPAPLRLVAHSGAASALVEFAEGTSGLVVTLGSAPRGVLRGAVALPPPLSAQDVRLRFVTGSERRERMLIQGRRGAPGVFEFWDLAFPEGRADVEVFVPGRPEPLARVEGVEVTDWDRIDPRLDPLVLGDVGRVCDLIVRDETGAALANASVWTRAAGVPAGTLVPWRQRTTDAAGLVRAVAAGGPIDVIACAAGRRYAELRGLESDAEIRLSPAVACTVTLRLAGRFRMPEAPFTLLAGCYRDGDTATALPDADVFADPRNGRSAVAFGADRTAVERLVEPGRYRVVLTLRRSVGGAGSGVKVETSGTAIFTISEPPADVTADVYVDPASFEGARRDLSR